MENKSLIKVVGQLQSDVQTNIKHVSLFREMGIEVKLKCKAKVYLGLYFQSDSP